MLFADDVTTGFRVDVANGDGRFRSLMRRRSTYTVAGEVVADQVDEGRVEALPLLAEFSQRSGSAALVAGEEMFGWDGWGLGVTITACILAYALFSSLQALSPSLRKNEFTILENNMMSSAASAAGYMSSSIFVGAVPALYLCIGQTLSGVQLALFGEGGTVADHESELTQTADYRYSYGGGVRFILASGFVVRLDLATGDEGVQPTLIFQYPWSVF